MESLDGIIDVTYGYIPTLAVLLLLFLIVVYSILNMGLSKFGRLVFNIVSFHWLLKIILTVKG